MHIMEYYGLKRNNECDEQREVWKDLYEPMHRKAETKKISSVTTTM